MQYNNATISTIPATVRIALVNPSSIDHQIQLLLVELSKCISGNSLKRIWMSPQLDTQEERHVHRQKTVISSTTTPTEQLTTELADLSSYPGPTREEIEVRVYAVRHPTSLVRKNVEECYHRGFFSSYTKLDFVFHTGKSRISRATEIAELILLECVFTLRFNNVPDSIFVRFRHCSLDFSETDLVITEPSRYRPNSPKSKVETA